MAPDKKIIIEEYDANEYSFIRKYNGREIQVDICDMYFGTTRYTLLYCYKYFDGNMKLVNASNNQIINEVDNLFNMAIEIIDSKSLIKKIKSLFE